MMIILSSTLSIAYNGRIVGNGGTDGLGHHSGQKTYHLVGKG